MKKCHRFSINYQKNKMPKILKCHLHRKLIEQMIDVPSALIANCAQLFFFWRRNRLLNFILRSFTPYLSDCDLYFLFYKHGLPSAVNFLKK